MKEPELIRIWDEIEEKIQKKLRNKLKTYKRSGEGEAHNDEEETIPLHRKTETLESEAK